MNLTADGDAIGCRAGFEDPIGSFNIEREDAFGGSTEVKPQQLSLQLRPGETHNVSEVEDSRVSRQ